MYAKFSKGNTNYSFSVTVKCGKTVSIAAANAADVRIIDVRADFCQHCGELTDNHNGWYTRIVRTMKRTITVVIHRLRCHLCGNALPAPEIDGVDYRRWYGKDVIGYCLNERIKKAQTTRMISEDVAINTGKRMAPANSTIFLWCLAASARIRRVEDYEIYPKLSPHELSTVHIDEVYLRAVKKKLPTVPIVTPNYFCVSLKMLPEMNGDEAEKLLRNYEARTSRLDAVISDGAEFYPMAIGVLDHRVKHMNCEFHMKRNMGRLQRELEEATEPKEKRRLRWLLKEYEKKLELQAKDRGEWTAKHGTRYITNNVAEHIAKHVRRVLKPIQAFGDIRKGNAHLELVRFQWNTHKFIAGKNKGKSPLELSGFRSDGRNWVETLGYRIPTF